MYLYSRSIRLSSAAALPWAREMRGHVSSVVGQEVGLWGHVLSPAFGTVSFTSWWEDLGALEAASAKRDADETYQKLAAKGAEYITAGVDDGLAFVVHSTSAPDPSAKYVGSVTALTSNGNEMRAMTLGVELATKFNAITGSPSMFCVGATGPYGGLAWFSSFNSLAEYQVANEKVMGDPGWLEHLDNNAGAFVQGSGMQTVWANLGQ